MTSRIYEYQCPQGHVTEKLVPVASREGVQFCTTPGCGQLAHYIVSAPKLDYLHMGTDPVGNPTAGDKWARMHREAAKEKSDNPKT